LFPYALPQSSAGLVCTVCEGLVAEKPDAGPGLATAAARHLRGQPPSPLSARLLALLPAALGAHCSEIAQQHHARHCAQASELAVNNPAAAAAAAALGLDALRGRYGALLGGGAEGSLLEEALLLLLCARAELEARDGEPAPGEPAGDDVPESAEAPEDGRVVSLDHSFLTARLPLPTVPADSVWSSEPPQPSVSPPPAPTPATPSPQRPGTAETAAGASAPSPAPTSTPVVTPTQAPAPAEPAAYHDIKTPQDNSRVRKIHIPDDSPMPEAPGSLRPLALTLRSASPRLRVTTYALSLDQLPDLVPVPPGGALAEPSVGAPVKPVAGPVSDFVDGALEDQEAEQMDEFFYECGEGDEEYSMDGANLNVSRNLLPPANAWGESEDNFLEVSFSGNLEVDVAGNHNITTISFPSYDSDDNEPVLPGLAVPLSRNNSTVPACAVYDSDDFDIPRSSLQHSQR
jgi:hypothetical protein